MVHRKCRLPFIHDPVSKITELESYAPQPNSHMFLCPDYNFAALWIGTVDSFLFLFAHLWMMSFCAVRKVCANGHLCRIALGSANFMRRGAIPPVLLAAKTFPALL